MDFDSEFNGILARNASAMAMGIISQGNEKKVFDWEKAALLIAKRRPTLACAGLSADWFWTGGTIWENGEAVFTPKYYSACLSSTWDTPVLMMDDEGEIECWRMESEVPGWDAKTYWPGDTADIARCVIVPPARDRKLLTDNEGD